MGCNGSHPANLDAELVPVGASVRLASLSSPIGTKQQILCLKLISANFNRSLDLTGNAFCLVSMKEDNGLTWEVDRTQTSRGGSSTESHWDYVCRGVLYRGAKKADKLHIRVLERNIVGIEASTSYCEATVAAHELLENCDAADGSWGAEQTLALMKVDEQVGTITVQAGINVEDPDGLGQTFSPVDAHLFETPVKPLAKKSVGGAELYALRLCVGAGAYQDVRGAMEEIDFYEECLKLSKDSNPPDGTVKPIVEYLLDYAGIVEIPAEVIEGNRGNNKWINNTAAGGRAAGNRPRQMLVLQNLIASFESVRMLDLKIGETSLDGTLVKSLSGVRALRQSVTDALSITAAEGFRVEAFSGPPDSFTSKNPMMHTLVENNTAMCAKGKNFMLQRLTGAEMFMYYADVHSLIGSSSTLTKAEFAEIVLGETVVKLCKYTLACRRIAAPQNFIRSSIGMAFDCKLPSRGVSEAAIRQGVRVKPFAFKESDVCSLAEYQEMDKHVRKARAGNWRQYRGGLDRLSWEAARAYENTFGNSNEWKDVVARIKDFDANKHDDFIGQVKIPLRNCENEVATLCDKNWKPISGWSRKPTLTYSVKWRECATGSRLRGVWAITVVSAANLPALDPALLTSDPYVKITASSTNGCQRFIQNTSVVTRNVNPQWNETFELPLGAPTGTPALVSLLNSVKNGLGTNMTVQEVALPFDKSIPEKDLKKALGRWQGHLTACQDVVVLPYTSPSPSPTVTPNPSEVGEVARSPPSPCPDLAQVEELAEEGVIVEEVAATAVARCGCKARRA